MGARTREGAVVGGSQDTGQARGEATPPDSEQELLSWSCLCASAPPSITPEISSGSPPQEACLPSSWVGTEQQPGSPIL